MWLLKNLGNTTLTWFLKLLNRISALPPNLALGMKTHKKLTIRVCLVYTIIAQLENVQFSSFGLSVFNLWRNVTDIPCRELPFYGRLCNFSVSPV